MENKKNRNKRLAIIAAMLALIVLILCLGGNTFAKYISTKTVPTQNATVAKWGYVISADATDLFAQKYQHGEIKNVAKADVQIATPTGEGAVALKATDVIVAPGTKGEMTIKIEGQAEVLSQIDITVPADATNKDIALNYKLNGTDATELYKPVKWHLTKVNAVGLTTELTEVTDGTLEACIDSLKAISAVKINPNTAVNIEYKLGWEWALNGTEDNADDLDTLLGLYTATKVEAAKDIASPSGTENVYQVIANNTVTSIKMGLKITVVQVQNDAPVVTP